MTRGTYIRTEKHREIMSKAQLKRYKEAKEKENKFNSVASRIENLSKEELEDKLASIRYEILRSVKKLGQEYKTLMKLQKQRDEVEERLEEIGVKIKD